MKDRRRTISTVTPMGPPKKPLHIDFSTLDASAFNSQTGNLTMGNPTK